MVSFARKGDLYGGRQGKLHLDFAVVTAGRHHHRVGRVPDHRVGPRLMAHKSFDSRARLFVPYPRMSIYNMLSPWNEVLKTWELMRLTLAPTNNKGFIGPPQVSPDQALAPGVSKEPVDKLPSGKVNILGLSVIFVD